jgi:peptidoglycan/xylan/chitin deacetylase (PgdA/CDA1 family)
MAFHTNPRNLFLPLALTRLLLLSSQIIGDILDYESSDPKGLNGFLLLFHLGADRQDKVFSHLDKLIELLQERNYSFVRVDNLLSEAK